MSRLNTIIEMQRALQDRVDDRYASEDPAVRAAYMRDHRGYLDDELAEALYEMPNYKLWKDYDSMTQEERNAAWAKVQMELVDAFHFFINLLLGAGMSADDLHRLYAAKNAENHRRQDAGYTADVSYRDQEVSEVAKDLCTVSLDGETEMSSTFVTAVIDEAGTIKVRWSADLLTVYCAIRVLMHECENAFSNLSEEERQLYLDTIESLKKE